jgi:BON domain-containing protein
VDQSRRTISFGQLPSLFPGPLDRLNVNAARPTSAGRHSNRMSVLVAVVVDFSRTEERAMFSVVPNDSLARARAALSRSKIRDLRRLTIALDEGRIVVRGRVSSFYHKQLAQELIRGELGDVNVVNEMQVA